MGEREIRENTELDFFHPNCKFYHRHEPAGARKGKVFTKPLWTPVECKSVPAHGVPPLRELKRETKRKGRK